MVKVIYNHVNKTVAYAYCKMKHFTWNLPYWTTNPQQKIQYTWEVLLLIFFVGIWVFCLEATFFSCRLRK